MLKNGSQAPLNEVQLSWNPYLLCNSHAHIFDLIASFKLHDWNCPYRKWTFKLSVARKKNKTAALAPMVMLKKQRDEIFLSTVQVIRVSSKSTMGGKTKCLGLAPRVTLKKQRNEIFLSTVHLIRVSSNPWWGKKNQVGNKKDCSSITFKSPVIAEKSKGLGGTPASESSPPVGTVAAAAAAAVFSSSAGWGDATFESSSFPVQSQEQRTSTTFPSHRHIVPFSFGFTQESLNTTTEKGNTRGFNLPAGAAMTTICWEKGGSREGRRCSKMAASGQARETRRIDDGGGGARWSL